MRRHEAERARRGGVAAAGDDHPPRPLEHLPAALPVGERLARVGCGAVRVGGERAPVARGDRLRGAEPRARCPVTQRREERPVRRLRARPHHARERVEEDDRAALDERRCVAPEAEHVAEAERRGGDRVERLTRHLEALPRKRDDECLERLGDRDAADGRATDERLRVSDRRRAGEGRDDVEPPSSAGEQPSPNSGWQDVEQPAEGRVRDTRERVGIPRIAAVEPGAARVVEHERESDDRGRLAQPGLELRGQTPAVRAGHLEERLRPGRPDDTRRARVEQRGRAAVEGRLRGADRDDEVGVDERRMRPQHAAADGDRAEIVGLAVVDDDPAAEVTRAIGAQQCPRARGGPVAGRDRR